MELEQSLQSPLQLIVLFAPRDRAGAPYASRLRDAFADGAEEQGYIGGGEDLAVPVRTFAARPTGSAVEEVDAALHTLVVVIDGEGLLAEPGVVEWLETAWRAVGGSRKRHAMLVLPLDGRTRERLDGSQLASNQFVSPPDLGEEASRPAILALLALHTARERLARALPPSHDASPGDMRLFISHAKIDGLPFAQAIRDLIDRYPWLNSFYDAKDITPGTDWQEVLEDSVRGSVLVALRTSVYHDRYWCRQEVDWADEYAVPLVVVEGRTGTMHPADHLPLSAGPTVTTIDGNLLRIVYAAMREGLRAQRFLRVVEALVIDGVLDRDDFIALTRRPSSRAILGACKRSKTEGIANIVYPGPDLDARDSEIAEAIKASLCPTTRLATPAALIAGPNS